MIILLLIQKISNFILTSMQKIRPAFRKLACFLGSFRILYMKAGVIKCQKNGLVILLALFLCISALFLRRAQQPLRQPAQQAPFIFLQVARGEHARVRGGLSFSPFACARDFFLLLKKPAPTTQATDPLASRDVKGPCFILHFTVPVCRSQNSSKYLSN